MQATIELEHLFRQDPDIEIVLVNDQNYFLFTPLLPQIASSYINPRHIVQPVRDIRGRRRFRFLRDDVRAIDLNARRVGLASASLPYDYLVLALGSRTDYFHVSGAREHTWEFKTLENAVVLRERILDLCEHADHTEDPATRRQMLTFVVVGGGYTGVELVTEMHDFFYHYVAGRYRGITPGEIRLRAKATQCLAGSVEVNGKEIIPADTVIWTAGVRAHELVEALPGPHDRIGRAVVNEHLQLVGHPDVFVVGDSAAAVS